MNDKSTRIDVYLNIYDLLRWNPVLHPFGMGAYHTGVQIYDVEFAYGSHNGSHTGVYEIEPRSNTVGRFRQSIFMGVCDKRIGEILDVIEEVKLEFIGCSYDVLTKNCNHFSAEFVRQLVGCTIPSYLNRLACVGKPLRCILPTPLVRGHQIAARGNHRRADSIHLAFKRIRKLQLTSPKDKGMSKVLLAVNSSNPEISCNNEDEVSQQKTVDHPEATSQKEPIPAFVKIEY
eukprot:TRINITY_DN3149_c0_g1_i1.p1 TRINITY_DN3149_c0_g1~~TRINITY_DN3149_c0_g1_i1.p1  ORF type:complete len:232 (+),score=24.85 TRINITY_DN3149_c0_g1_i1:90-785(+)